MMLSDNLNTYLLIAVFLLIVGIFGMIQHRSFIGMLVSTELILSGAGLNFMAFNRFLSPNVAVGQIFTMFIMGIAAAEAAIGVSIILAVYRKFKTVDPDEVHDLRG